MIHECEICGHQGSDVVYERNPYKEGWFCQDPEVCFQRFNQQPSPYDEYLEAGEMPNKEIKCME